MSATFSQPDQQKPADNATVDVVFPRPPRRVFTYRLPPEIEDIVRVGHRVRAPFGGNEVIGVVVARPGTAVEGTTLRLLRSVIEPDLPVPPDLLSLTRWVAEYYMCAWGEALGAAVGGTAAGGEMVYRLPPVEWGEDAHKVASFTPSERKILRCLSISRGVSRAELVRRGLSQRTVGTVLRRLVARGVIRAEWRSRKPPIPADAVVTGLPAPDHDQVADEVRQWFKLHHPGEIAGRCWSDLAAGFPGGRAALRRLMLQNAVCWEPVPAAGTGYDLGCAETEPEPGVKRFDPEQRDAFARIAALLDQRRFAAALLWGPTGSGKTAVYCAAVKHVWAQGRNVLFLVPEISLAGPMVRRLTATLGESVGIWHSGLTGAQRYWMARRVAEGRYRLVIGARSAVFAPIPDLGLVIVDEEHSTSYKQSDPAPRYHARDLAVIRSRIDHALCLLGSATPSCESFHNADRGKYVLLRLRRRVSGRAMPLVHLVDLSKRPLTEKEGWVTEELQVALVETIRSGRKAIVFLNRRGYATMVACRSCGHFTVCPACGLTLTYHSHDQSYRCHVCDYRKAAEKQCPRCGSSNFLFRGVGTQRVEEILGKVDQDIRLARLDADVARRRGAAAAILTGFARGEYNLLLGTQMVAKGLDVPGVGLVGVIWADQQMAFPDFRAEERTFQLITQVAGRAGRSGPGRVLIQTFRPDHDLIELAAGQDTELFFQRELPLRKSLFYPPYSHLVLLAFSAGLEQPARTAAARFARFWNAASSVSDSRSSRLLGPAPAAIPRQAGRFLFHCLIKTRSLRAVRSLVESFRGEDDPLLKKEKVAMVVDVDPVDFW